MFVETGNARFWVEDEGDGPPVVFLHGGPGDSRLFEPQAKALADAHRCIRFDLRLFGRTEAPGEPFSWVDDTIGVLDALDVERAALVGLSFGGGIALDVALGHPDRVTALVHVAAGMSGMPVDPYTAEQRQRDDEMEVDLEVWAPLGADDRIRHLWRATPDANPLPDGVEPREPEGAPAKERLGELRVPTLVVTAKHDPPGFREIGPLVASAAPDARHLELDSDHYVTLREPELVSRVLLEFLTAAATEE
jgi:3-oxoadipate enol-lactonase